MFQQQEKQQQDSRCHVFKATEQSYLLGTSSKISPLEVDMNTYVILLLDHSIDAEGMKATQETQILYMK